MSPTFKDSHPPHIPSFLLLAQTHYLKRGTWRERKRLYSQRHFVLIQYFSAHGKLTVFIPWRFLLCIHQMKCSNISAASSPATVFSHHLGGDDDFISLRRCRGEMGGKLSSSCPGARRMGGEDRERFHKAAARMLNISSWYTIKLLFE